MDFIPVTYYQIGNKSFVVEEEREPYHELLAEKLELITTTHKGKFEILWREKDRTKRPFVQLEHDQLSKLFTLTPNTMKVLIYLLSRVNKNPNTRWGNLGEYYQCNLLTTLRTQTRIANDLKLKRPHVNKAISYLEEKGLIIELKKEKIKIAGKFYKVPVYVLGIVSRGFELYFYEILL